MPWKEVLNAWKRDVITSQYNTKEDGPAVDDTTVKLVSNLMDTAGFAVT